MAKQLTPAEIAAYMKTLGLTDAPPTEAVGAKGSKPFVGNKNATTSRQVNKDAYTAGLNNRVPVQNMNDLSSPVWLTKYLAKTAKKNFFDPIWNMPKAFDPTSGLSPMDRVTTGLGGGLAIADVLTPFLPDGALGKALAKRISDAAWAKSVPNMTKPVGPTAADWFFGKYGLHGSPTQGITELQPRLGSNAFPDDMVTYAMDLADPSINYDIREAVNRAMFYAPEGGSVYAAKYPRGYNPKKYNAFIVSDAPGKVVGEIKLGDLGGKLGNVYEDLVTDSAYQLQNQLLANIKSPSLRKKFIENMLKKEKDQIAEQAKYAAETAARSENARRSESWLKRQREIGTGDGVS
jgi:hypothetical protein